ncbi:MAG TPA: serine--tRNA ligase [Actinomycetota bacterium]|nr:serine--tRNA ligase [Actinomycetota bacterium]
MLDLRALRDDPDAFRAGLARRGAADKLDIVLELDARLRGLKSRVEELRAEQNRASKEIGRAAPEERRAKIDASQAIATQLKELEPQLQEAQDELDGVLLRIPNLPHESVPDGRDDEDNVLVKEVGQPTELGFEAKDHVDLGAAFGLLDLERAARSSGSRFVYLMGPGVWLEFALVRYALDFLAGKGFTPVIPPVLVREEAMYGTGFLPTDESQIYATRDDDLYLVGTSEVPLASFHQDEILETSQLPVRYAGFSTCFRREAGTYGKDTRGMFRVHQFDKVEMFSFCEPDASWDEHEFLVSIEEEIVQGLGLPYRLMNVCTGELGASAAKKIDLEAWFPGQGKYRELTSCSNCTDYQARRLGVRVRSQQGDNRPLHTLNGTACAVGRTIIAVLENHQRADGSVELPGVLHPYLPAGLETLRPA